MKIDYEDQARRMVHSQWDWFPNDVLSALTAAIASALRAVESSTAQRCASIAKSSRKPSSANHSVDCNVACFNQACDSILGTIQTEFGLEEGSDDPAPSLEES